MVDIVNYISVTACKCIFSDILSIQVKKVDSVMLLENAFAELYIKGKIVKTSLASLNKVLR